MKLGQRNLPGGFTLIEFLVIVAVMAILVAMLLPGLTAKRVQVNRTSCVNNLKQVSLAFRQWALDNNDKFPTEVSVTNGGAMESVMAGNVAAVFQVMSNELSTPKLLFCPDDKRRIQATTFYKAAPVGGAYPGVYFSNSSNASYFVNLDSDSSTPQMLLLGDDNLLVGGKATINGVAIKGVPVKQGVLSLWTNTPVAWSDERHKKQGNVGLADGSVQGYSSSRLAEALRSTGAATNRLVFP
jgi:prepilin-type processing-associated H-X9-DG protein